MLRVKISKGGKISIPSIYRKKLHLQEGDEVLFDMKENTLIISSLRFALEKARQTINKYHSSEISLVDQLIEERREVAKYE